MLQYKQTNGGGAGGSSTAAAALTPSHSLILLLLLCAGIPPNPGPLIKGLNMTSSKTFMQFNCNGIQSSKAEIQDFLIKHQVKVAAIQETKLTPKSKSLSFTDYNLVRKDCPIGRGGLAVDLRWICVYHSQLGAVYKP
jgi:hypothetical protein